LRIVEYRTADGLRLKIEVSPEIALALADDPDDPGPRLKEKTFTDLGRMVHGQRVPLNGDTLDPKTATRRIDQRPMPTGEPWEGPRFHFDVVLGTGRTTWFGKHVLDEFGRCGLCHDQRLPASTYCGNCDRCGRDREIGKATPKPPDAKAPVDDGRKGGKGSAAKVETRREKRAKAAGRRRAG
jgi:hypothetical protein